VAPTESIDFYYAIGSRYSYLAASQVDSLEKDADCRVQWHPLDSRRLIRLRGIDPFSGAPSSGQYEWAYREVDAKRWAQLYGIPFLEPRNRVLFDPELLAHAATAAKRLGRVREFSQSLFSAMFAEEEVTRIDREECIRRAAQCAMPRSRFEAELDNPGTADEHVAAVEKAHREGAFGVPTFVVNGTVFWGNDRLVLLRHHLSQRSL
jgi:2-hydroxychromene-2-carboxylate isomerase